MTKIPFALPTSDLLVLLNSTESILSGKTKLSIVEQIIQRYHVNRDFNLYEEIIHAFYKNKQSFHLGKTSLGIEQSIPKTIKIIDLIAKHEITSTEEIPSEHAKFLFALIKEFILVIEKLVNNKQFQGDYQLLLNQITWLKQIMSKSKNNSDILTIFDNVIRNIENSNPLLLESEENKKVIQFGELKLNSPLYKMSKAAFLGVLENLQLYNEEDFYKIVEFALSKHDSRVFYEAKQSKLPIYIAAMKNPTKKMSYSPFEPHMFFANMKKEDLNNMHYYPLPCTTIEEFYQEYCLFLDCLENNSVIGKTEKTYLHYRFLKSSIHLSDKLLQLFIDASEILLIDITSRLKNKNATQLSQLLSTPFTYTDLDELIFLDMNGSKKSGALTYKLKFEEGKITGQWNGKTVKKDDIASFRSIEVPREDMVVSEYEVFESIQRSVIEYILPLLDQDVHISNRMKELIEMYEEKVLHVSIDTIDEEVARSARYSSLKESLFVKILKFRLENQSLVEKEVEVIFGNEVCLKNVPFNLINASQVIYYLKTATENHILNIHEKTDLEKLLLIKINDRQIKNAFLADVFYQFSPEVSSYLASLVNQDELESEMSLEDRKNELIIRYFSGVLKQQGFETVNYIF